MTIELGLGLEEWEKEAAPPLIPDGTYEFIVDDVEDTPVKATNRPQWRFKLKIINRPDLPNRSLFYYAQLPWINPANPTELDISMTFGLLNLIKGTHTEHLVPGGRITDSRGSLTVIKETFKGAAGVMKVGHQPQKDDPETINNTTKIVVPKKGGVVA